VSTCAAPNRLLVAKRIAHGGSQPLWQHLRVIGRQAAGDVVGGQERAQAQHILSGGRLGAQALDRDGPDGGDGLFGRGRPAELEQLPGADGKQLKVVVDRGGGLFEVRGGRSNASGRSPSASASRWKAGSSRPSRRRRNATESARGNTSTSTLAVQPAQAGLREVTSTLPRPPPGQYGRRS
jgi:hypothetical protein